MYLITWLFQAIHKKPIFGFTSRWRRVVGLLYKQTKKQRERLSKRQTSCKRKTSAHSREARSGMN